MEENLADIFVTYVTVFTLILQNTCQ